MNKNIISHTSKGEFSANHLKHGQFDADSSMEDMFSQGWGAYDGDDYSDMDNSPADEPEPDLNLTPQAGETPHNTDVNHGSAVINNVTSGNITSRNISSGILSSPFEATMKHGRNAMIPLDDIHPSDLNDVRKVDPERVSFIADSIRLIGLLEPLTVYKNKSGSYTIYGGHVRYEAIQKLKKEIKDETYRRTLSTVPCIVIEAPKNDIEEMEVEAALNMHRYSEEDRDIAIRNAKDMWDRHSDEQKAKLKEYYRNRFVKSIGLASDDEIRRRLSNDFRPIDDYIRAATGFNLSNRTITKIIGGPDQPADSDNMTADSEKKKKSEDNKKELTIDTLRKKLDNFRKSVDKFNSTHNNAAEAVLMLCLDVKDSLDDLEDSIGGIK